MPWGISSIENLEAFVLHLETQRFHRVGGDSISEVGNDLRRHLYQYDLGGNNSQNKSGEGT